MIRNTHSNSATARTRGPLLRRLAAVAASVGVATVAALSVGLASPASATVPSTKGFYGECDETAVTAYAPDMNWYPDNSVTWYPTLYVWTDSGWAKITDGPTQTAVGAEADGDPWAFGDSWMQSSYRFGPLEHGHYYAVSVSYIWAGPGVHTSARTDEPVTHHLAQNNFDATSWQFSNDKACYIS